MISLLRKKYGLLCFGLFGGLAYFGIIFSFVAASVNHGALLGFFFAPVIICLPAIALVNAAKKLIDEENYTKLRLLAAAHAVLFVISAVRFIMYFCA